jgi:hypothetical protein
MLNAAMGVDPMDVGVVRDYARSHPGVVVDLWLEDELLVVLVWGDEGHDHEAAIRGRLGHPDRLRVMASTRPKSDSETIMAELEAISEQDPGALRSWGATRGLVRAMLRADQEPLALDLHRRYGEGIIITLGVFPYPELETGSDDRRWGAGGEEVTIPGLDAHVVAPDGPVASGDDGQAELVFTNVGPESVSLATGMYLAGYVLDRRADVVLGGYTGGLPQPAIEFSLQAGQARVMGFVFGTASYRPEVGYALPPGRYRLGVAVPLVGSDPHHRLKGAPLSSPS